MVSCILLSILTHFVKNIAIPAELETEMKTLMEEVAMIKTKDNQTTGFCILLSILRHFVKRTTISAEFETEVEALKEEVAKIKMKDNQTAGSFHTSISFCTFC